MVEQESREFAVVAVRWARLEDDCQHPSSLHNSNVLRLLLLVIVGATLCGLFGRQRLAADSVTLASLLRSVGPKHLASIRRPFDHVVSFKSRAVKPCSLAPCEIGSLQQAFPCDPPTPQRHFAFLPNMFGLRSRASTAAAPQTGQDMGELFDICEPPAEPNTVVFTNAQIPSLTGKVKERGRVHQDGDWHRSVHVWLLDSNGELLLQKRSEFKDTHPNCWDVSCAGHINAGANGMATAVRELEEELGLNVMASSIQYLFTFAASVTGETANHGPFTCNEFQEVYLVNVPGRHATNRYALEAAEVAAIRTETPALLEMRWRANDTTYVPRSPHYVAAFLKALHLTRSPT